MYSEMAFACGFLIVGGFCFMPYEWHNVSKCNLDSEPLPYIMYQHLGYLHNQILLTYWLMQSDELLMISLSIIFTFLWTILVSSFMTNCSSTISNQLEAGLILVRAMKSIAEPSLLFSAFGPTRVLHNAPHAVLITILDGKSLYLCVRLLFPWQILHDFVIPNGISHPFPAYCSFHHLFETGVHGLLKKVVIPHDCMQLQMDWE
jgi:hypothetical protein